MTDIEAALVDASDMINEVRVEHDDELAARHSLMLDRAGSIVELVLRELRLAALAKDIAREEQTS